MQPCNVCRGIGEYAAEKCEACGHVGYTGMREVAKDEWYNTINPLDVVGHIPGRHWPYTMQMQDRRTRQVLAVSVDSDDYANGCPTRYYLP